MSERRRVITRKADRVPGLLISVEKLVDLPRALAAEGVDPERTVFSDLTMGAWGMNWVAREFFAQAGEEIHELPDRGAPVLKPFSQAAEEIGRLIDAEARGAERVISALRLAQDWVTICAERGTQSLVIFPPAFGETWEYGDELFLTFVGQGLAQEKCRIIFVDSGQVATTGPPDSFLVRNSKLVGRLMLQKTSLAQPWASLPGLLAKYVDSGFESLDAFAERGDVIEVTADLFLVAPERRPRPAEFSAISFDTISQTAQAVPWLSAFLQYWAPQARLRLERLLDEVAHQFACGAHTLALRLLHRAARLAANSFERAMVQSFAQGIRLSTMRFEEAASAPLPPDGLPDTLKGSLEMSVAWGMVMMGRTGEALSLFQKAGPSLTSLNGSRESLYFKNIHALALFRNGSLAEALAFEREIGAALSAQPARDWHLEYINNLNLARVSRAMSYYDRAREHYRRAFQTSEGGWSPSDRVYFNICLASVELAPERHFARLTCLLRAALHWCADSCPEALAHRVAKAILRGDIPAGPAMVEAVSKSLAGMLAEAAASIGINLPLARADSAAVPVLTAADRTLEGNAQLSMDCALGAEGWGVLLSPERWTPAFEGEFHRALRAAIANLLEKLVPGVSLKSCRTLFVDDRVGRDVPQNAGELLESALCWQVSRVRFADSEWEVSAAAAEYLENRLQVQLGPLVSHIETTQDWSRVYFKRLLPPITFRPLLSSILLRLSEKIGLRDLATCCSEFGERAKFLRLIRFLEGEHVLSLSVPNEDAFGLAG